ncbi:hypothetical protein M5K25_019499 [Dendrobium thyrsiflorum]|uniref:Uncharacterized protein n=1 Tax=Dendrobium thyrsiflorum TaxID=117978 RepID=A0ABD0UFB5_DENTH
MPDEEENLARGGPKPIANLEMRMRRREAARKWPDSWTTMMAARTAEASATDCKTERSAAGRGGRRRRQGEERRRGWGGGREMGLKTGKGEAEGVRGSLEGRNEKREERGWKERWSIAWGLRGGEEMRGKTRRAAMGLVVWIVWEWIERHYECSCVDSKTRSAVRRIQRAQEHRNPTYLSQKIVNRTIHDQGIQYRPSIPNHSLFPLIYSSCYSRKSINRAPFLLQKDLEPELEEIKGEIEDRSCPLAPPRPPPELRRTTT